MVGRAHGVLEHLWHVIIFVFEFRPEFKFIFVVGKPKFIFQISTVILISPSYVQISTVILMSPCFVKLFCYVSCSSGLERPAKLG